VLDLGLDNPTSEAAPEAVRPAHAVIRPRGRRDEAAAGYHGEPPPPDGSVGYGGEPSPPGGYGDTWSTYERHLSVPDTGAGKVRTGN
jgi:hypothetical protein